MKYHLFYAGMLALVAHLPTHAQGFNDEPTCYSWEGGHKSSGSFSKCSNTSIPPVKVAAAPTPVVVPAPIMQSCPPTVILEPEKPKAKAKPRPKPQKC